MPVEDYLNASGVRVHAKEKGVLYDNSPKGGGRIWCSRASKRGIDSHLFAVLKIAVDQLHISININSVDTGKHAVNSRHYTGRAVDINRVGIVDRMWRSATLGNPHALRLVEWLRQYGFAAGESKPVPAALLGPARHKHNRTGVDHSTHLHVSLSKRKA